MSEDYKGAERRGEIVRLVAPEDSPPHAIECEQAVIGAILLNNAAMELVSGIIAAEHFIDKNHARIFEEAGRLIAAGMPATPITMKAYLGDADLGGRTVMEYLARLAGNAVSVLGAPGYAKVIRDMAARRAMLAAGERLVDRARNAAFEEEPAALLDEVETDLLAARAHVPAAHLVGQDAPDAAAWMLERIKRIRQGDEQVPRIPTGIAALDRALCGGLGRGHLAIIAARPGMGKTVALTTLSRTIARRDGVLVFQLEVPREQQYARYLADLAYTPHHTLTFGQIEAGIDLDDQAMWLIEHASKRFSELYLHLETDSVSIAQIAAQVKIQKRRFAQIGVRLGVVFIDYLKFVRVSDRYRGQRVLEIGEISGALKTLAKAEDVCIVLLCQLNREVEKDGRPGSMPTTTDLRDSGELEQDADVVILLHRRAVYLERKLKALGPNADAGELAEQLLNARHEMQMILGKNRGGATETLDLWCDVSASTIASHARGPQ